MIPADPIWLESARRCPSPNFDQRPDDASIDLLVIHNISLPPGEFSGDWIEDFFLNRLDPKQHPYFREIRDQKVSAHLLIKRSGELIQFVPLNARAWHAGLSEFEGRHKCNDFSIGIELEGADDQPFDEKQYQALTEVTRQIMRLFPGITPGRIVGHSDIAPERKTDPGPCFDWNGYRLALLEQDQKTRIT